MSAPFISVFNDVLGPVMRGPSSSHTAASHRIGRMARALLGETVREARFSFDPSGSYARVFRQQGVDLALAAGLMGWDISDDRFKKALLQAEKSGIDILFRVSPLANAGHPNDMEMEIKGRDGGILSASARSTGGGAFLFTRIDGYPVMLEGKAYIHLFYPGKDPSALISRLNQLALSADVEQREGGKNMPPCILFSGPGPLEQDILVQIRRDQEISKIRSCPPLFFVQKGPPLFLSGREILLQAGKDNISLGELVLRYETQLLGMSRQEVLSEMIRRFQIMKASIKLGLDDNRSQMKLLGPSARSILEAEARGELPLGGPHTRAAARALAVMHISNSMGVVCAAPTGGSAGVIPGVVSTLVEEYDLDPERTALALLAAGGVGLIVARRATFAAEIAGCQVEIGAAGAMAAASVIEASGGTAQQALDAAAISFQNTMGSVCDLVQGMCEIPCHTRNAAAASAAFTSADLVAGGYVNPIPLDETIDAVLAVGKTMPCELRVTSLGGLAITPSALALKPKKTK